MNKRLHTRYVETWLHNNKRGQGHRNPLSCGELYAMVACVRRENTRRRIIFPMMILAILGMIASSLNASIGGVVVCATISLLCLLFHLLTKYELENLQDKDKLLASDFMEEAGNLLRLTRNCKPLREGLRDGTLTQFESKHECSHLVHLKTEADQTPGCMWLQNEYRVLDKAMEQFGVTPKPSRTPPPMQEPVEAVKNVDKSSQN